MMGMITYLHFFTILFYFFMRISHLFNRIALAFVMVAMVGSLASCTVTPAGPSKTELITRSAGWKFDSFSVGSPTPANTLLFTGMTVKFSTGGSAVFTPSASAVAAGAPASYSTTWTLSSDETVLSFGSGGPTNGNYDIPELSATTLRYGGNITGTTNRVEFKWAAN